MKNFGISCCHNCENRSPNCHSTCSNYIEEKRNREEYNKMFRKKKEQSIDADEFMHRKNRWK